MRTNLKYDKTISNGPATVRFEMILTQKLELELDFCYISVVTSFCNHKMGIVNMHQFVKAIFILFKKNKVHLKSCSEKPHCAICNIGVRMPKQDFFLLMP